MTPIIFSLVLILLPGFPFWFVAVAQTTDASHSSNTERPKLTPAQWRDDLQFAVDTFLPRDRSFSPEAREQFRPEFGKRTLAELQSAAVSKIVVDVRFNTGGDLSIGRPFITQLGEFAKERKIKVYVIVGRATFSAGLYHAMQLRQYADATLVGEPVGDELDFWAEGGNAVAPNSKLSLHYADRLHS